MGQANKESSPSSSIEDLSDGNPVSKLTLSNNLLRERSKIALKKPKKLGNRHSNHQKLKPKKSLATTPVSSDGSSIRQQRAVTSYFLPTQPANEKRGAGN